MIGIAYLALTGDRSAPATTPVAMQKPVLLDTPAPGPEPYKEGQEVKALLKKEAFAEMIEHITALRNRSTYLHRMYFDPYDRFFSHLPLSEDGMLLHLNRFVDAYPDSAIPYQLRAQYYHDAGWKIRSGKVASQISRINQQAFTEHLRLGAKDAEEALKRDPDNPYGYYLLLLMFPGNSEQADAAYALARAKHPDYMELYRLRLDALLPKWGGSFDAMRDMVEEATRDAPDNAQRLLLWPMLYQKLAIYQRQACNWMEGFSKAACEVDRERRLEDPALLSEIRRSYERLHASGEDFLLNSFFLKYFEWFFWRGGYEPYATRAFEMATHAVGWDHYAITLSRGYIFWQKDMNIDAERYYRQGMEEVKSYRFPSPYDRNRVLSIVYERLSRYYDNLSRLNDAISYAETAVALDPTNNLYADLCYNYAHAPNYTQAIIACSAAIEHENDRDMAYYWRGRSYRALGNRDQAMADFTTLAAKPNSLQGSAVIQISTLYADAKEYQQMIDLFTKYPFVFNGEDKNTTAVAYNNRCCAYMELGQDKEALEDCTRSLQFDFVPDAKQKLDELRARLKR